ncbi:6454_t:CDS:2 [Paraglomus occultum]|uniref:6454_t:CDS:1 n=1 Tax=Paraglomus occultum TaxID=144539 RepID=A0A9N8Z7G7_9GLOM|nr:6454_t:CDS:2 [Paraglomus occultum]
MSTTRSNTAASTATSSTLPPPAAAMIVSGPFEEVTPPVSLRWDYVVVNRLPKGLSSVGIKDILDAMQFR